MGQSMSRPVAGREARCDSIVYYESPGLFRGKGWRGNLINTLALREAKRGGVKC
jgi:hypothetical protein